MLTLSRSFLASEGHKGAFTAPSGQVRAQRTRRIPIRRRIPPQDGKAAWFRKLTLRGILYAGAGLTAYQRVN